MRRKISNLAYKFAVSTNILLKRVNDKTIPWKYNMLLIIINSQLVLNTHIIKCIITQLHSTCNKENVIVHNIIHIT